MSIKLIGELEVKGETVQVSESFQKRVIVLKVTEENSQYIQMLSLEVTGDYTERIDRLEIGNPIECFVNLRGRKWESPTGETKYFNSIQCWKIDLVPVAHPVQPEPQLVEAETVPNPEYPTDLPF